MTVLPKGCTTIEESTDYNRNEILRVMIERYSVTPNFYLFTCKITICHGSSGFFTPYKAKSSLIFDTAIQSFGYCLVFKSWEICLKFPPPAHFIGSFLISVSVLRPVLLNVQFVPLFHLCSPGFAFAKWRSFVFQSGKVTGSDSGGVIDLTLDEEDDGSSQGRWKILC